MSRQGTSDRRQRSEACRSGLGESQEAGAVKFIVLYSALSSTVHRTLSVGPTSGKSLIDNRERRFGFDKRQIVWERVDGLHVHTANSQIDIDETEATDGDSPA